MPGPGVYGMPHCKAERSVNVCTLIGAFAAAGPPGGYVRSGPLRVQSFDRTTLSGSPAQIVDQLSRVNARQLVLISNMSP